MGKWFKGKEIGEEISDRESPTLLDVIEELRRLSDRIDVLSEKIDTMGGRSTQPEVVAEPPKGGKEAGGGEEKFIQEIKRTLKDLELSRNILYEKHPKNGQWYFSDKKTSVFVEPQNAIEGLKKVEALLDTGVYEEAKLDAFWDVFKDSSAG